tara:strand:- start:1422 stop:1754 length:333 start_codon:yes stop_codon:yes gene_type:complete
MFHKFRKAEKQVCFEDFDKKHADLKIRLHYDSLRQNEFFRLMMRKYINKDESMMKIINEYKEQKGNQSAVVRKKSKQLIKKGKELEKQFALDSDELENIFDLLEEEHSEL